MPSHFESLDSLSLLHVPEREKPIAQLPSLLCFRDDPTNVDFHYFRQVAGYNTILGGRDVVVMLPRELEQDPNRKFPAVYMLDGENLFEAFPSRSPVPRWQVARTCRELIDKGQMEPGIIVAVFNGGKAAREADYTHVPHPEWPSNSTGFALNFSRFLFHQLMPAIDALYPTEKSRAGIIGSSLGGLFSLFAMSEHRGIVSKVGALSPSLQWDEGKLINRFEQIDRGEDIFLVAGQQESAPLRNYTSRLYHLLRGNGWNVSTHFQGALDPNGSHNEISWRSQLKLVLPFLYPKLSK